MSKKDKLYFVLAGFFITNALLGELLGSKLIEIGPFIMSIGVLPWPIVLITTDLINEHFGVEGVRRLTFATMGLIVYSFVVIFLAIEVPAAGFSPVNDEQFGTVFGQSLWIIFGSLVAFLVSQFVDVYVFRFFKRRFKGHMLWLRASGSTAISQLFDSIMIIGIAFWLPGKVQTSEFLNVAFSNYSYKFLIAVGSTPIIYLAHYYVNKYIGFDKTADNLKSFD